MDNTTQAPTYLKAQELATKANVHLNTVYNWIDAGVPHRRVGTTYRFVWDEVDEWLRSRTDLEAGRDGTGDET